MYSLFVVSFENLTYFEVISLIPFVSVYVHLVAKPAGIIDALLQKLSPKHLQNEVFFVDLDDRPSRLAGFSVSLLYYCIQQTEFDAVIFCAVRCVSENLVCLMQDVLTLHV